MCAYKPLQQKAYEYLKEMIEKGELVRGQMYSETQTAARIGISRTPVKDALVRLSQDGYIDIIPSKGFQLHVMTPEDIRNTYQTRIAVEGFSAIYLHRNRDSEKGKKAYAALQASIEDMERAIHEDRSFDEILRYDMLFHRILVEHCGNRDLLAMFEAYNHRLYDIAMKSFELAGRPAIALEEHKAIFRHMQEDPVTSLTGVYEAIIHHMYKTKDTVLTLLDE